MTKKHKIVYLIDDDGSIRKSLSRLFRSADLNSETFLSPEEFLSSSRQTENACIVADLRMPGSTGFDLAERLITDGICIPLIIISAANDVHIRQRALELGAAAFFQKPVDDQAILDAILWAIDIENSKSPAFIKSIDHNSVGKK
jgi:FixJ family two-component response regulator